MAPTGVDFLLSPPEVGALEVDVDGARVVVEVGAITKPEAEVLVDSSEVEDSSSSSSEVVLTRDDDDEVVSGS